nr:hypothetical protein [bacterium]
MNKLWRSTLAMMIAGALAVLGACGSPKWVAMEGDAQASGQFKNYISSGAGETMRAGEEMENITLSGIKAMASGKDTVIELTMGQGENGQEALAAMPYVEVSSMNAPARIILWMEGIGMMAAPEIVDECLVQNTFEIIPVEGQRLGLVFHLTAPAAYAVSYENSKLTLHLKQEKEGSQAGYHVVWYDMDGFVAGKLPLAGQYKLWPSLCADEQHKVLISARFDSQQQAEDYRQRIVDELQDEVQTARLQVVQLEAGALPAYSNQADMNEIAQQQLVRKDGELINLPVVIENGRLLTTSADGKIRFFCVDAVDSEETLLYIQQENGVFNALVPQTFHNIDEAALSPDGKLLAFVDCLSDDMRVVNLYNMQTQRLMTLSEEGLGMASMGMTWSFDSRKLTVIAGESEILGGGGLQVRQYVIGEDGTGTITALEEQPATNGKTMLGIDGKYYITQETEDDLGALYAIDSSGRTLIAQAANATMSADGRYMAYIKNLSEGENAHFVLVLRSIETGEETILSDGASMIIRMFFAPDQNTLYYALDNMDFTDTHPFELYSIACGEQAQGTYICDVASPMLDAAGQGLIYISLTLQQNGVYNVATYSLNPANIGQ